MPPLGKGRWSKRSEIGGDAVERRYNKENIPKAKALRKNMTKEERHLWYDFLRSYPVKFYRQKVMGRYIVDFYCAKANLIVELDGSQHYEEAGMKYDAERTSFLQEYGVKIIRIPNNEVNRNFVGVCEYIDAVVKKQLEK